MNLSLKETIQFQDAVNNFEAILSIDLDAPGPIGIQKGVRIVSEKEEMEGVSWLSGEGSEVILEILDASYYAVYRYLSDLIKKPNSNWKSSKNLKNITTLMALIGNSTDKIEKYLSLSLNKPIEKISQRPEYTQLHTFYQKNIANQIQTLEPEIVDEEMVSNMETVRQDKDYELFYIRHEDGSPYFDLDIVRHMRVIADFDAEGDHFEDDPLLQIRTILDRDVQASAKQIIGDLYLLFANFAKVKKKHPQNHLADFLYQAIIALFLSANPQNLIQNTTGKSSLLYFQDFYSFLRSCFQTTEYQKHIAYPDTSDAPTLSFVQLAHSLCYSFFHRICGVKQEMIGLIHRTARRGTEKGRILKGGSIWEQFLIDDENFRSRLAKFPNGPLLKTLDLLNVEKDPSIPFDPLVQGNFPNQLFTIEYNSQVTNCLHVPSPTRQFLIHKVEIVDEWRGMLRYFHEKKKGHNYLFVQLQDKSSWKESARCKSIESLGKIVEFSSSISVLTIPKDSDFYYQSKDYDVNKASDFFKSIQNQFKNPEECGWNIPSSQKSIITDEFIEKMVHVIHLLFFNEKSILSRQERLDFIEIFDHLLVLKMIEKIQPNSFSFTCKDSLDIGASFSASFFAFIKMLGSGFVAKEEIDYFRYLLYAPALLVRERAIDQERVNRAISMLSRIDLVMKSDIDKVKSSFEKIFSPQFLKTINFC